MNMSFPFCRALSKTLCFVCIGKYAASTLQECRHFGPVGIEPRQRRPGHPGLRLSPTPRVEGLAL